MKLNYHITYSSDLHAPSSLLHSDLLLQVWHHRTLALVNLPPVTGKESRPVYSYRIQVRWKLRKYQLKFDHIPPDISIPPRSHHILCLSSTHPTTYHSAYYPILCFISPFHFSFLPLFPRVQFHSQMSDVNSNNKSLQNNCALDSSAILTISILNDYQKGQAI